MSEPYTHSPRSMQDRVELEQLLIDVGLAINANGGRCGVIESALCRTTTLVVEFLRRMDDEERPYPAKSPGKIVTCTNLDSVRVEVLGESRAVTIPASLILAMDRVLTAALAREESLEVNLVEDDDTKEQGWQAMLDMGVGAVGQMAPTPWGAILKLAEVLER